MATYHLTIVTPTGTLLDDQVEGLVAPGAEGEFGVLAHHAPLIAALRAGCLKVRRSGRIDYFAVSGGFVRVDKDETVVLADQAGEAQGPDDAVRQALAFATPALK